MQFLELQEVEKPAPRTQPSEILHMALESQGIQRVRA
jgi:hypothetical protein